MIFREADLPEDVKPAYASIKLQVEEKQTEMDELHNLLTETLTTGTREQEKLVRDRIRLIQPGLSDLKKKKTSVIMASLIKNTAARKAAIEALNIG